MEKIGHTLAQIELAQNNKVAAAAWLPSDTMLQLPVKVAGDLAQLAIDGETVKVAMLLDRHLDQCFEKVGFIPNPQAQGGQGGQMDASGAPQGQPGQSGQGQPGQDPAGGQHQPQPDPAGGQPQPGQDPAAQQAQAQAQQQAGQGQPQQGGGEQDVTNLDAQRVTLSLRDVLDLVSGGKATASALKIQNLINNSAMQAEAKQRAQAQKEQQAQQQAQMGGQQQGGMMGQGGIYPSGGDPSQGGVQSPQPQQAAQPGM